MFVTAVLYLAAGVGGAIASMATLPGRVSVGASGAIFGMLGALLAFLLIHRRSVPGTVLRPLAIECSELRGLQHPVRRGGAEHRSGGPHGRARDRISGWPGVDPAMARDPVPLAHPRGG